MTWQSTVMRNRPSIYEGELKKKKLHLLCCLCLASLRPHFPTSVKWNKT